MIDQQTLNIKTLPILQVICLNSFCQQFTNKMKKTKQIPHRWNNSKIVERGKIDTPNTQM